MRQMNSQIDTRTLVRSLVPIARRAGDAIMEVYAAQSIDVLHKADDSPVTAADLAAHRVLLPALTALLPGCPVVSEEDAASQAHRRGDGRFWLIDPLDGTKEFIARNGEFTVNIALVEDGCSVLGVVYAPAIDTLYWGGSGIGAFRAQGVSNEEFVSIKAQALQTGVACRVVASKSHLNAETQAFIDRLGEVQLVQAGSSLKFCRVAEGEADIYPRLAPTCEWDTAAAQAVLEGAGGIVVDVHGQPLRYGKTDVLNPPFVATRDHALIPA